MVVRTAPLALLAALAGAASASPATAQDNGGSDVVVTVTPYIWVPTVTGDIALGPVSVPVRVTPDDFADGIRIGGMGGIRIDTDRKFVYLEGIFADYRNANFKPFFSQGVTSKIRFGEIGVGITRHIRIGNRDMRLSPHIGIQHLRINALVVGNLVNANASGKWTSPAAGLEIELPVNDRLDITSKFDAAGFGIADTDYRSASVTFDFRLTRRLALSGGYRVGKGRFGNTQGLALDLAGDGPMIGLRYRQ